jgi:hypothetical protein
MVAIRSHVLELEFVAFAYLCGNFLNQLFLGALPRGSHLGRVWET